MVEFYEELRSNVDQTSIVTFYKFKDIGILSLAMTLKAIWIKFVGNPACSETNKRELKLLQFSTYSNLVWQTH